MDILSRHTLGKQEITVVDFSTPSAIKTIATARLQETSESVSGFRGLHVDFYTKEGEVPPQLSRKVAKEIVDGEYTQFSLGFPLNDPFTRNLIALIDNSIDSVALRCGSNNIQRTPAEILAILPQTPILFQGILNHQLPIFNLGHHYLPEISIERGMIIYKINLTDRIALHQYPVGNMSHIPTHWRRLDLKNNQEKIMISKLKASVDTVARELELLAKGGEPAENDPAGPFSATQSRYLTAISPQKPGDIDRALNYLVSLLYITRLLQASWDNQNLANEWLKEKNVSEINVSNLGDYDEYVEGLIIDIEVLTAMPDLKENKIWHTIKNMGRRKRNNEQETLGQKVWKKADLFRRLSLTLTGQISKVSDADQEAGNKEWEQKRQETERKINQGNIENLETFNSGRKRLFEWTIDPSEEHATSTFRTSSETGSTTPELGTSHDEGTSDFSTTEDK